VEQFRATAAGYAEIGLRDIFVIPEVVPDSPRTLRPAVGTEADDGRLERITELLTAVGEAVTGEGVMPILHPHVGTWVETEQGTRHLLAGIDPSLLGVGPDIGHLSWAGADPIALIEEYTDRVRGVHVKDLRRDVRDASIEAGRSYQQTVGAGLWIEPGRGDVDHERLWAALGADFDGTIVIEVDKGDIDPPFESARACARWVEEQRAG